MIVKLYSIVDYQDFKKSKLVVIILINEIDHLVTSYVFKGLNLYPFSEVVNCYKKKLFVTRGLGKRTQDIHLSLEKKPQRGYNFHLCRGLARNQSISLVFIASSSQTSALWIMVG